MALVAHRHAAAALVVEGDAQPHQFYQPRRKRPTGLQRHPQRTQRARDVRPVTEDRRHSEVDPVTLAEITHWDRSESR
jgi:hypothetical protein